MTANSPSNQDTLKQTNDAVGYEFAVTTALSASDLETASVYQGKIARYLFEIGCLYGLRGVTVTRSLPMKLFKYFDKVVALYDAWAQYLLSCLRHRGLRVKCRTRCPYCCYNMPSNVSTIELVYAYHGMRRTRSADRFFRRCLEAQEVLSDIFQRMKDVSCGQVEWSDVREKLLTDYLSMGRSCPFLEDDMCQIYAYRPFACRVHFSLSSHHWCHPDHFQYPHALAFNFRPGTPVARAFERLDNRFELDLSDLFVCGLLEFTVNVMEFQDIHWRS